MSAPTDGPRVSEAGYQFLGEYAAALGNHALRCPAITVEAAREWAKANGIAMKSMFLDGTFVEVDGRPLLAGAAPQGPEPTSAAGQIAPGVYYEETETGAVAIHDSRRRWEPLSTPAKEPAQLRLGGTA